MGVRPTHYCDVFNTASSDLRVIEVVVFDIGLIGMENVPEATRLLSCRKELSPRALARLVKFIGRGTSPPSTRADNAD